MHGVRSRKHSLDLFFLQMSKELRPIFSYYCRLRISTNTVFLAFFGSVILTELHTFLEQLGAIKHGFKLVKETFFSLPQMYRC